MPCLLDENEIIKLENNLQNETDIKKKEIISEKYEEYKSCVEEIKPLIVLLKKYCSGKIEIKI